MQHINYCRRRPNIYRLRRLFSIAMLPCTFILFHASLLILVDALSLQHNSRVTRPDPIGPIHTLILTRHGDSMWNGKYPGCQETFTGWTDVGLSPIGEQEAIRTGQLLTQYTSGMNIDALFTSTLTRAKMTAHECWWAHNDRLEELYRQEKHYQYYNDPSKQQNINPQYQAPSKFIIDYRLNERHYGSLQGLVKAETEAGVHGHSSQDVYEWRRSWHSIPPQLDDNDPRRIEEIRKYGNICGIENLPKGESLAQVAEYRIRPFLDDSLTPVLDDAYESKLESTLDGTLNGSPIGEGGTALVVAHANSLRALMGVICNVEEDPSCLQKLESMKIPTASPLILRYRKTTEAGKYCPVDCGLADEVRNDLPVYPLSSLPILLGRRSSEPEPSQDTSIVGVDGNALPIEKTNVLINR